MKRTELKEIKILEPKQILIKVKQIKSEITNIRLDRYNSTKNNEKAKDIKDMTKKRRDIAQMLTIARQKILLEEISK